MMGLKRKTAVEVPPKIRSFINYVIAAPLESIGEPLKSFVWDFDKGDFHQWVDLFNHFDFFYEKYIKSRKDLQVEDDFLGSDPPFPKDAVLQILRVIKIILENCTNKHLYSSYEQHLSSLLASTDADVVEASLQTLATFLKKTTGKYVVRDSGLHAKLFGFAQGWGAKEEGLGLVVCAIQHRSDQVAYELGSTLHFEFYADDNSNELPASEQLAKGLQVIDLPNINAYKLSDIELFHKLVTEYKVPPTLRFSLFTRLRFARAFNSIASRQQYTCIRLYAFMAFVSYGDYNDLASFCEAQPEFINELVTLLSYEDAVPENIQILSLLSLVVLCQGCTCTHQSTVLAAVTSCGLRGILCSLMQKAIGSVSSSSKWSIMFAEALLSLVTVLVYSSSSRSAMLDAGFIPILLPLLKDSNPQHLHLVSMAVHILEAILGYSNPASTLFIDLGGLNDAISRLKIELSDVEDVMDQQGTSVVSESSACITEFVTASYSELDSEHPLYSETVVASHRRSLLTALLRAISLVTCAPRSSSRYGPEESLLLHCLSIIFKKAKKFGGGLFSLGATVMSKCIRKDPTCFSILEAAGLPSAFLDAVMDGVLFSAEAVTCIPLCLDALCLSSNGLRAVRDCNALRCFVEIFTSRMYLPVLTGLTVESLSIGLDELMRHASSLRVPGVEMLIDIFNSIAKLGSRTEVSLSSSDSPGCSTPYPVKTVPEEQNVIQLEDGKLCKTDNSDKLCELTFDILLMDVEVFLPEYITNATRLLETILQNSETCCIFIEKKGIEAVLQLFMLPHMPLWASVGRRISAAFKNLFPKHPVSLVQAVCSFLREHLQLTNDILSSTSGAHLDQLESVTLMKLLRCLSGLDGILSVCISLLKGTAMLISELATSDAVVLIELGRVYRDINWQISLCSDIKVDEKPNVTAESVNVDAALINTAGRESDDDVNIPVVRNMNPASVRNNLHPQQGLGHDFLSLLSSGEGFSRLSRHGLARICGGRTNRHLETLQIDSEVSADSIALPSSQNMKKKRPEVLSHEILNKLSSTLRSFFIALVKGFTLPNHRRSDTGSIAAASKCIGTALAKVFLEALGFSKCSTFDELSVSGKCRYLGNVVDDMIGLVYDSRRRTSYTAMINNFYSYGTFEELLTTFEATSQLLWTQPYALPISAIGHKTVAEGSKLAHNSWLRDTLKSYCSVLEYFVNSALLLCPTSVSQTQMLVQPVAVGLSMGLFPVPKDPEVFVRILQSQVLDVILPVWNHPMFPNCSPAFISSVVSLVTHIYSGVGDVKRNHIDMSGSTIQRSLVPPPPVDDILMSAMKLLETSDSMAFPLTDLLVTVCSRNKGEDARVTSYLTQQLKLCPLQIVKYPTALCMVSHTLALLLNGDGNMRDIVVRDGIVSFAIDILMKFKASTEPGNELVVPKCISALLLILDNLSQSTPRSPTERTDVNSAGSSPESNNEHAPMERKSAPKEVTEKQSAPDALERGINTTIENIFGKSTGYLTFEESSRLLMIACDLIKLHVPPLVMQAILHLCARLTKTHTLALQFLEIGGLFALFSIPKSCFFPGYDTVTSAIIRHLIEDPQTLRTAMELEIRQKLRNHRAGRVPVRAFLKSMAPVISRDPAIFMKAAASICHLESFRGRTVVFISKEKEKERQKTEVKVEPRALSNDCVQIRESKINVAGKGATGHKKIPANVTQVIDQLLQVLSSYPAPKSEEKYVSYPGAMDIDEPLTKMKGKSKVDETRKNEPDNTSEKSTGLVKVTFVLKLLTDILEIYVHAVGVILKRDVEMCQLREPNLLDCPGHGGILSHVLNHLVLSSVDRTSGPGKWREKLSQKASWFLVILCGRSSEGRRRVITEIVKALTSLSNLESSSSRDSLCPDKKVLSFVNLVYLILLKNSSSSDLPCTGCSSNIAKSMINGGIVQCLSCILQVMDLDHPDASKVVNCILRSLEILTRAANAGEQLSKSETFQKKTLVGPGQSSDNQADATLVTRTLEYDQNRSQHEVNSIGNTDQEPEGRAQEENDLHSTVPNHLLEQDIRGEAEEIVTSHTTVDLGIDFMRDEMEDGDMISNPDSVEMTFHVENRGDYDMGEQDDDMGQDGEEVDDDEEEDITEDGTILMSLADTDVDDHDEADLEDDYSDDTVDEDDDDDDFYERLFEVRWREAFDGLDDDDNDLFGLRSPIGFDHRRQTSRNLFDRSITEGNCFQHPLFSRPSQFSDLPLTRSSGGNSSRDLGSLSAGSIDGAHLYMCDALAGPYNNVLTVEFGERLGAASSADFSVGLESLHVPGRRAPGAGRWTDDGYPQINGQSAVVAQAVEKQFICQLRGNASSNNPPGMQSHVSESQERHFDGPLISDSQIAVQVDNIEAQQCEDQHCESGHGTVNNHIGESIAVGLEAGGEVIHNNSSNGHVNMEIGEGTDIVSQQGGVTTQGTQQFEMTFEVPPSHRDLSSQAMNNDTSSTLDCHTNINTSNISVVEMPNPGVAQQAEGQVEMDNASIIATFPSDMREGVPLTSSELAILSAPSPLVAEAQMLRDRAMSHSQAHSLSGNDRRYSHRRNGLAIDRQTLMGRGVGVTIGQKASSFAESMKLKEVEGILLLDTNALKALIRLLRLAQVKSKLVYLVGQLLSKLNEVIQPLGKGVLQRLLSNLCAHSCTRAILVRYLIDMINPGTENSYEFTSRRLYGCQSNVVYGRSQLLHGVPPLVMLQVLEVMIYLANSHSAVANILFYFDPSLVRDSLSPKSLELKTDKGKEKTVEDRDLTTLTESLMETDIPLVFLLKLLRQPLFLRSNAHMERVLFLIKIVVSSAAIKLVCESHPEPGAASIFKKLYGNEQVRDIQNDSLVLETESDVSGNSKKLSVLEAESAGLSTPDGQKICMHDIFLQLPECDLHNLCSLLGNEGLSDKVYLLAGEVMRKLAEVVAPHRKFFILQLLDLAHSLSSSAVNELVTLRNTRVLCLSAGSITGAAMLRVLQTLGSLASPNIEGNQAVERVDEHEEHAILLNLNISLGPLWQELSNCISTTEMHLAQCSPNLIMSDTNVGEHVRGSSSQSPLPPGTQRLLPFIEAFLVLCEKLQAKNSIIQQDHANETAREVKEFSGSSASFSANSETDSLRRVDGAITFMRFAEKHRRLLNAFIRQNPGLLEKTLAVILKLPRVIDFDNKRAYFRSRIRKQHEPRLYGPLPISVRRAYILEDSYNQLRKIPTHFLKARLIVHFQGEEGVDAGGLTREWYQLLSRAIFDKGALLFTTGGDNATFQPNPNSVYQTEHLSYFKFVGRVIAKALYDGQLLDVYFTRSFYKHILGIKVTYHDIEAVDPDYYKNLKWMLVNNVSEIPDLTFSMDVDEEKHILNGKAEVTEYELKPGGGNIRVTEETKHEYVDLVAEHILTNAIRPQINSFLEGFTELIPRELISIFNDKELELLISGLPEIDLDDLKANTEYTGYTMASNVVQWFWEVIKTFNKEDTARFLQFVTGTSKVPLEGFRALQGNSGPQKFNICKAYGGPERLPSAHTCFNQLDLPQYISKEQLQERLLLAIHEASEGFGFK